MPTARKTKAKPSEATVRLQPLPEFDAAAFHSTVAAAGAALRPIHRAIGEFVKRCDSFQKDAPDRVLDFSDAAVRLHDSIANIQQSFPGCAAALNPLTTAIDTWRASERRTRQMRFEAAAKQLAWTITGSWPEPVIQGIVFVVLDDTKDRASINGKTLTGPPTAGRLIETARNELAALQAHRTEPAPFIDSLWKAYKSCSDGSDGSVSVFELLAELTWQRQSKNFKRDPRSELFHPYPIAQFRADLTSYLAAKTPLIKDGRRSFELEIVGGSFAQDGLFMYFPQTDRLATCGRLSFRPTDQEEHP
jgi:hypothetical protein